MSKKTFKVTKDVTKEDYPWLDRDFQEGEIIFLYEGHTYGCITEEGIAMSLDGKEPFFEFPKEALH